MPLSAPAAMNPRWIWLPLPRGDPAEPIARAWLGPRLGCPAETLSISRDGHGRPRLDAPFDGWDCNWSHSGAGLLVALGEAMQLGIDLEWQRPRPRALELARRFFHDREFDWLAALAGAARERAFLRVWCAKEAVLKAHGRGLAFGLDRLAFVDTHEGLRLVECDPALGGPTCWTVQELAPAPGYLGALAWRPGMADHRPDHG